MKNTISRKSILCLFCIMTIVVITGCAESDEKFERGEGDFGEGEPCVTTDDCDEKGEICVEGVCIYEENA